MNNNRIVVLSFGHLPISIEGKQSSGLANVIWSLANNINKVSNNNLKNIIAATDVHVKNKTIDQTDVIGWNRELLLKYGLSHPWLLVYYAYKTIKLSIKYGFPILNLFAKMLFYHKSIYFIKPDFIHLHSCTAVVFFEIWRIGKFKVFATLHGLSGQDKLISGYKNHRKMEEDISSLPLKFVVFISDLLVNGWLDAYGEPIWEKEVIVNAYDNNIFYYDQNIKTEKKYKDKFTIATVASISYLKGQNRVLEALAKLKNRNYHYICIGQGKSDQIDSLHTFANNHNVSFEYTGYLSPNEIREKLTEVDFMILPSSTEGFGLVFLESIACGVPIILPKTLPIVKEKNILNPNNSILLEDESSKSILKILLTLNSFTFSKVSVANTVSKYSWEHAAKQYVHLINRHHYILN